MIKLKIIIFFFLHQLFNAQAQTWKSYESINGIPEFISGLSRASEITPYFLLSNSSKITISLSASNGYHNMPCFEQLQIYERTIANSAKEMILRLKLNGTLFSESIINGWQMSMNYFNLSRFAANTTSKGSSFLLEFDDWENIKQNNTHIETRFWLTNLSTSVFSECEYILTRQASLLTIPARNFSGWQFSPSTMGYFAASIMDQSIRLSDPLQSVICPVEILTFKQQTRGDLRFRLIYSDGKYFETASYGALSTQTYRKIFESGSIRLSTTPSLLIELGSWTTTLRSGSQVKAGLTLYHGPNQFPCKYLVIDYFNRSSEISEQDEFNSNLQAKYFWSESSTSYSFKQVSTKSTGKSWSKFCPQNISFIAQNNATAPLLISVQKLNASGSLSYSLKEITSAASYEETTSQTETYFDTERNRTVTLQWWQNQQINAPLGQITENLCLSMLGNQLDMGHVHCAYEFKKSLPGASIRGDEFLIDNALYYISPLNNPSMALNSVDLTLKNSNLNTMAMRWLFVRVDPATLPNDIVSRFRGLDFYRILSEYSPVALGVRGPQETYFFPPATAGNQWYLEQIWILENERLNAFKFRPAKYPSSLLTLANPATGGLTLNTEGTQVEDLQLFILRFSHNMRAPESGASYILQPYIGVSELFDYADTLRSSVGLSHLCDCADEVWIFNMIPTTGLWTISSASTKQYLSYDTGTFSFGVRTVANIDANSYWILDKAIMTDFNPEIGFAIVNSVKNCYLNLNFMVSCSPTITTPSYVKITWKKT